MADVSYKNASQVVALVGADSNGVESNFVQSDVFNRLLVSPEKHEPLSVTVIAEAISLANNKSLCSIVNSSDTPIYIKEVWLTLSDAENFPSDQTHFVMIRITGHTSGTNVPQKLHDLSDSVPSNVTAKTGATVSGEDSSPLESTWFASQDLLFGGQSSYAVIEHALGNQMPFWNQTPGTKAIVLRNGQGLSLKCASNTSGAYFTIRILYTT